MGKIAETILSWLLPTTAVLSLWHLFKPKTVGEILDFSVVAIWFWLLVFHTYRTLLSGEI